MSENGERTTFFAQLEKLRAITIATPVNERIIDQALVSDFDDLEDAMQYFSAISAKVDVVLTRNKKDFIEISVPVMTPDEFFID